MMKKKLLFIMVALSVFCISCGKKSNVELNGDVVTKKILYDVPVVNLRLQDRTEKDPNWFWENLPYPSGDNFIDNLYADARDCNIPIYYYEPEGDYEHLDRISDKDVKSLFENDMKVSLPVPDFYDEATDSYVSRPNLEFSLSQQNIMKLRFLEEWRFDNGMIQKKVLAVAPVFTIILDGSETQMAYDYNTVKFWIMADESLLK